MKYRETILAISRYIALGTTVLLLVVNSPALAGEHEDHSLQMNPVQKALYECENLPLQVNSTQKALYEYALIADAAYGKPISNSCRVKADKQPIALPEYHQFPLLSEDHETEGHKIKWKNQILEYWRPDLFPKPNEMGQYISDDGITYITCSYDGITPQLALTWKKFQRTLENPDAPIEIGIRLKILPVISRLLLPPNEELGIIQLNRNPPSEDEPEELVAIRGTDFTKIPQIMASMYALLSGSCVYEMAASLVKFIGSSLSAGRFSVVGHSLGGGATQYIVQNHINRQNSNVTFSAYSFNAIGLATDSKRLSTGNDRLASLYSYVIDGEIVSWFGEQLGRTQAGTIIRYLPPDSWPDTGVLTYIKNIIDWEQWESIRRHRLSTVQQGLCECLNGHGAIQLSLP